eukprot:6860329-Prymnesium_polylepis.1
MSSVCYVHASLDRKTARIGLPAVSLCAMVAPRTWGPSRLPQNVSHPEAPFSWIVRAVRSLWLGTQRTAPLSRATHSSSRCPPTGRSHSDRRLTHPRMSYKLMLSTAVCVAAAAVRRRWRRRRRRRRRRGGAGFQGA